MCTNGWPGHSDTGLWHPLCIEINVIGNAQNYPIHKECKKLNIEGSKSAIDGQILKGKAKCSSGNLLVFESLHV